MRDETAPDESGRIVVAVALGVRPDERDLPHDPLSVHIHLPWHFHRGLLRQPRVFNGLVGVVGVIDPPDPPLSVPSAVHLGIALRGIYPGAA